MKKEIYILIGLMAAFSLALVLPARAADMTDVTVSPGNVYGGYTAGYAIGFTTITTILTASTTLTEFTFPGGFNVASAATSSISGFDGALSISGQIITVTGSGYASGAKSVTFTPIVSPSAGGNFTVTIRTLGDAALVDTGTSTTFSIFGGRQVPSLYSDAIPPTSSITSPTSGVTIVAGEKYVIQGITQDQGGSTVQKVEVSLDGGQSWSTVQISALANVFSWEYVWQNPTVGEYIIKARATDAVGNIESALIGVKVTVSVPVPPTPPVLPEKPITEMTIQELQAKITEVQQKIVDLLRQLIQFLQGEIQKALGR